MLHIHKEMAQALGVKKQNIFLLKNGDAVDIIGENEVLQTRSVDAGDVYVDGLGIGDVGEIILRDRKQLASDGMIVIIMTISKANGQLVHSPDTISRGLTYGADSEELIQAVNKEVTGIVNKASQNNLDQRVLKQNVKKSVEKLLYSRTKRKPMILPIIIEI